MKKFLTLALGLLAFSQLDAQVRYINEVFTDVNVTTDVVYGSNVTVLPLLQGAAPAAQPLACDIYEPAGDTETERPLIIYIHTGNFLPQYLNGSAVGNKNDSTAVELCTRYAKMGYVVASIDYRLGWNPLAATQQERTFQLINAAYRGVQDARTAVRYFRMTAAEQMNPYGIDSNSIGYLGEGTGGYVSYAASTISDYNDIIFDDSGAPIEKFWWDPTGSGTNVPMVVEGINGDPEATTNTNFPPGYFGPEIPVAVPSCIANHPGYSSDVSFQVNLGGALGDLNWLDAGDPAMISFQSPHDAFAPYTTDILIVPTTNEQVVSVSGAFDIHAEINAQMAPNNNAVFQSLGLTDVFSARAIANGNQGWDGLYPVLNDYVGGSATQTGDGAPWQWWDVATTELVDAANGTTIVQTQLTLNPNMGPLEGRAYCDTIVGYSAPRLAGILGLASAGPGCTDSEACNYNALATSDDGSCTFAAPGFNCAGDAIAAGCTDPMACNYDNTATLEDGSCDYLESSTIPTGSETLWLVGLTLTGTANEAFAAGCEAAGGVNPNVSINGVIVGDGAAPLTLAGITDPTGLLADLAALASTVSFGICGDNITVSALGNIIPMVGNGQYWQSPIPVTDDGSFLWAAPLANFPVGCADPSADNFSSPCDLSLACQYSGCTDATACNFDPMANVDDGSCQSCNGCTDPNFIEFNPYATTDDGSCATAILEGCRYENASNYNPLANVDDNSCVFEDTGSDCPADLDNDGAVATADLLQFLSSFGQTCL